MTKLYEWFCGWVAWHLPKEIVYRCGHRLWVKAIPAKYNVMDPLGEITIEECMNYHVSPSDCLHVWDKGRMKRKYQESLKREQRELRILGGFNPDLTSVIRAEHIRQEKGYLRGLLGGNKVDE